ncbi:hypothetical protein HYALB_00004946 [Hymenoscyphus albidus]|uniref:ubiquitinyl hydrolase 1 n=1 Tax=Hymenoscyphus albidus TaxID=595503 RepID=A0A9N9LBB3_9HELO|nr:hypothetical protein HYALB_00004946 [Hymenoscyphus albidus]
MNPYRIVTEDLFDGDPDPEYHQDYREGITSPFTQVSFVLPLCLCLLPLVYQVLVLFDYDLLPIPELLWNCLVYLTPSRLLDAVEEYQNPLGISDPALKHIPRTHAAKSQAMRRVLGIDTPGGVMASVAQASRRLSILNLSPTGNGRPAGLGNWDNSCYQNSVLQGLASLDSLTGYLATFSMEKKFMEEAKKPETKMADALRELIATLNDPENDGKRIWTPSTLKNMSSWQQQDAQEYFSKVLDEIDKEIGGVAKSGGVVQGLESERCSVDSKDSKFRNPMEGLLAQRVGCLKCGHSEGLSMVPFNCLTVPLGKMWSHDIVQCLDEFTKLEQIEGVECGKCTLLKYQKLLSTLLERSADSNIQSQSQKRLDAINEALEDDDYEEKTILQKCKITTKNRVSVTKTRQAVVARPPRSLVVHFNRSVFDEMTGDLRKNHSEVRFPKTLDLGPWCLGSAGTHPTSATEEWHLDPEKPMVASSIRRSRIRGPSYELRAVITHYGRHENGHYICYKKHAAAVVPDDVDEKVDQEQWWRLSDDDVMKVSEENVLGQGGVFMLFYDCIEPAAPVSPDEDLTRISELSNEKPTIIRMEEPGNDVSLSPEPARDLVPTSTEEISLASTIPLPASNEDDFLQSEVASEFDDEEDVTDSSTKGNDDQPYEPVQAILVRPYVPQTGGNTEGNPLEEATGKPVMV